MRTALILLAIQGTLGACDTIYYHEYKLRLAWRAHARRELALHAARDFLYTLIFCTIGWVCWNGVLAWVLCAVLLAEVVITLSDFIEEDRTRTLPPGERAMHAIMGIVYGLFLANLAPFLLEWSRQPTRFVPASYGWLSWILTALGIGVLLSGLRDYFASKTPPAAGPLPIIG